ncbi:phenylalanine--tRNA ligase subunit alpha [Sulfuracidifex metallicus]|jgi:phenylalanyl-tRNA synthetase alpha chain|uniref:Phenylalanine--tRNA ligase alpha subunit n=1 Tax=Sulfuracidifex metallicus DSM 6482 = JCM 9184 TaxID=523847 RepID=A0A6A9QIF4_SULME|nr:phenylalanine--tRNA ligase subunit alpha [Sulfuracidifex metallicus]MUN28766.1 phenylalanine--tRNA ligase subunit alpha [Sulfuracidifex metallicus DSM 6482 = JCM 9184]WOE50717.1 phenylalanine--tRNA ligase subunit alpha [Sulfuracidifex metallicus DSM 6482 = JCM 9184]
MLSEKERNIVDYLSSRGQATSDQISKDLGMDYSSVLSLLELLKSKGIVDIEVNEEEEVELTEEGKERATKGLPEEVLINEILKGKEVKINDVKDKMGEDFKIAITWGKKKNLIEVKGGVVKPKVEHYVSPELETLRNPNPNSPFIDVLVKRGLLKKGKKVIAKVTLLKPIASQTEMITTLTHDILVNESWKNKEFRPFNVEAFPPFFPLAKKHFFKEFLDKLKDVMVGLGFKEIVTDYIEIEFYNFDLLFQPQDHPAREIHDSFSIKGNGNVKDSNLISNVKEMHEKWWKYTWNPDISKRLLLRSHTTATTARTLASRPTPPFRSFTIGKVFRPDAIDATHILEFHQLDGLIIEEDFSFKDLLGVLKEIFARIGIEKVKFKPAYFPFTEPSVEAYGLIGKLGWVELSGAGMLRPEILEAVKVKGRAGAWGLGIERLAMLYTGTDDVRKLYSYDIEYLRDRKVSLRW